MTLSPGLSFKSGFWIFSFKIVVFCQKSRFWAPIFTPTDWHIRSETHKTTKKVEWSFTKTRLYKQMDFDHLKHKVLRRWSNHWIVLLKIEGGCNYNRNFVIHLYNFFCRIFSKLFFTKVDNCACFKSLRKVIHFAQTVTEYLRDNFSKASKWNASKNS